MIFWIFKPTSVPEVYFLLNLNQLRRSLNFFGIEISSSSFAKLPLRQFLCTQALYPGWLNGFYGDFEKRKPQPHSVNPLSYLPGGNLTPSC